VVSRFRQDGAAVADDSAGRDECSGDVGSLGFVATNRAAAAMAFRMFGQQLIPDIPHDIFHIPYHERSCRQ